MLTACTNSGRVALTCQYVNVQLKTTQPKKLSLADESKLHFRGFEGEVEAEEIYRQNSTVGVQ